MDPTKEEITTFLKQFKKNAINKFVIYNRMEFRDTLAYLGIKTEQAKQAILGLTYLDYSFGPEKDNKGRQSNIWVFGIEMCGEEIYIKLCDDFKQGVAICISFHVAGYPINYPFKPKGDLNG